MTLIFGSKGTSRLIVTATILIILILITIAFYAAIIFGHFSDSGNMLVSTIVNYVTGAGS